ncbi:MAG: FtsX-like permease family protein [Oscillospiraceae bacterium]|nr:FtsX-like permease family protein [Oscillospiraceae bacterium]
MNIIFKLTTRQMWHDKPRTLAALFAIILPVAMACAVVGSLFVFLASDYGIALDETNPTITEQLPIMAAIVILLVAIGSIILVTTGFNITIMERIKYFGLLKCVGVSNTQIKRSIIYEAIILGLIAIPIGIVTGLLIQVGALIMFDTMLQSSGFSSENLTVLSISTNPTILITVAITSFVIISACMWKPLRLIKKTTPIEALNLSTFSNTYENETYDKKISITNWRYKLSSLIMKLIYAIIGYEGVLAYKTIIQNKKRYRAIITTVIVSLVLFIITSVFVEMMSRRVEIMFGNDDYNFHIYTYGSDKPRDDLYEFLSERDDILYRSRREINVGSGMAIWLDMKNSFFSDDYLEWYFDNNRNLGGSRRTGYGIHLIVISDEDFFGDAEIVPGKYGKLINTTGDTIFRGRWRSFRPFNMIPGDELIVSSRSYFDWEIYDWAITDTISITLISQMFTIPESAMPMNWYGGVHILIPESTSRALKVAADLLEMDVRYYDYVYVNADNPGVFLADLTRIFDSGLYIESLIEQQGILLAITLVGYTLVAMISLISITMLFSMLVTAMFIRRREIVSLFSIGMTNSNINKMLGTEILFNGIKALVIAITISWILSYFVVYNFIKQAVTMPYNPPYIIFAIAIVTVSIIISLATLYSKRKLQKMNIIEVIKNEAV